ncbi:MAG: glycoside hydrolase [Parabacteroides distasonis]|nr:glycoside hydrolase [Parabacteroides distasonis]
MKKTFVFLVWLCGLLGTTISLQAVEHQWKAKWISKSETQSKTNTWLAFRKKVNVEKVPKTLIARIAADTKYWLWINKELVVFEGGLKRGPSYGDSYFDEVEIAPYLKEGENHVAILLWHFGRNGFSHINSGMAAVLFEAISPEFELISDRTWEASVHHSFQDTEAPHPNYRMAESNIRFDARKDFIDWNMGGYPKRIGGALELPMLPGQPPFGKLVKRPIPLWKNYGLREYVSTRQSGDTLICRLPYNCHVTPYLKVEAPAGKLINMQTDQYQIGDSYSLRAEYITREGVQEFECYGWINGHYVYYFIPEGVKVLDVKFRETGYDTEFSGKFHCNDEFFNEFWDRAVRTLYVCMRDTYLDCPDRERGQWWGDEVNELGEAFYALSPSSHQLAVKGIHELMNWQKPDGSISAPVPAGNYFSELPAQMLASVGWYGFHNQYFYSGDSSFIPVVYDRVKRYLHETWKLDEEGLPIYRKGGWDWIDAGKNKDKNAVLPCWYYLALKGERVFAAQLGKTEDVKMIDAIMKRMYDSYNKRYWNGTAYRSADYTEETDDRAQALAVISGLASPDKYPAICKVLEKEQHAQPFMEKYVLEAIFQMGKPSMALDRMKQRYPITMTEGLTTLGEHFTLEGSSVNHAWTGAPIILFGQKLCGIEPLEPGFRVFRVAPQMGYLKEVSGSVDTKYGLIEVCAKKKGSRVQLQLTVPEGTTAEVQVAENRVKRLEAGKHTIVVTDKTK